MQSLKPMNTPLATYFKLFVALSPQTKKEVEHMSCDTYASAVGTWEYHLCHGLYDARYFTHVG